MKGARQGPGKAADRAASIARPPAHRITLAQCVLLLLSWASLTIWDDQAAASVVYGGLIAVIPNAWFALGMFRWRGASVARQAVKAGYAAEIGKFLLTAAGFALVFATVRPLVAWAVFAGYIVMLVTQVLGAWWLLRSTVIGKR